MTELRERLASSGHRFEIMGVVNVTPDSFSDGGQFETTTAAVDRGVELVDAGAEIVDIGGESTRPGSRGIDAETELSRVVPVITGLLDRRPDALVSIDTSKPDVARAALDAGAVLVNDVTAGGSAGMFELVAERGAAIALMHMRGQPRTMQKDTRYDDVVEEVRSYLVERAVAAVAAGVNERAIFIDPGIGFGKDLEGNLALLRGLPRLADTGFSLIVGTSRKSFLGLITGAPVDQRVSATLASLIPVLAVDTAVVRVHDVKDVVHFRGVVEALKLGRCELKYG